MRAARARVAESLAGPDRACELVDPLLEPVQAGIRRALPEESIAKEILSGSWIGHPVHPLLTDVVVGSWLSAWILDSMGSSSTSEPPTN